MSNNAETLKIYCGLEGQKLELVLAMLDFEYQRGFCDATKKAQSVVTEVFHAHDDGTSI